LSLLALCLVATVSAAQARDTSAVAAHKQVRAVRLQGAAITVDG